MRFVPNIILAAGIVIAGFFPGYYYYKSHTHTNTVVVKGLAERDVVADLAIWDIKFVATGNELVKTKQNLGHQTETILKFLDARGFNTDEIYVAQIETNDLMANPYSDKSNISARFIMTQKITVRTTNVDGVASSVPAISELITDGVVFENQYESPVSYIFTGLNDIKPQMLETATQNARTAALEFAKSSGSRVGKIHHANQGVFSITSRDDSNLPESHQINKRVRVVSTVEYYLN